MSKAVTSKNILLPPASEEVKAEPVTVTFDRPFSLQYQYLRGEIVLTRLADGEVLAEGEHYEVDRNRGWIYGLEETADFECSIAYRGYMQRVDWIMADSAVVRGTERKRSPSFGEAEIMLGAERPHFRALHTADGTDLLPVHLFDGNRRIGTADQYDDRISRNRARLKPFLGKIETGKSVRVGLYADSIGAMGALHGSMNKHPNSAFRDRLGFFQEYDPKIRARIPTYDFGDSIGHKHIREGVGWRLKEHLEAEYCIEVDYRNWSVGGSTSENTSFVNGGVNVLNGAHPDRLKAICADGCDLVVIAFGMNRSRTISADFSTMVSALRAAGSDVLVLTPLRLSPLPTRRFQNPYRIWLHDCMEMERVADKVGAACAPSRYAFANENLGALGMSERELCELTLMNHPGLKELNAWASLVTDNF